jgi:hypothetical protein
MYTFAGADALFSNHVLAGMAATGAAFCFIVLSVISVLAWNPISRSQLDRVSFRILICALVANMFFGVAFTMCATLKAGHLCSFSAFLTIFCLDMSGWLIFSIALNLVLVLIYKVNGQQMEKFYIAFALVMSMITSIPPYARGQYGWDPLLETCWYRSGDDAERLRWQIGTQLAWTMTIVLGETACFLSVLFYMLRHEVLYGRELKSIRVRSQADSKSAENQSSGPSSHAHRFRGIILRIGLYPVASWMLNITTVGLDIYQTTSGGIRNRSQFKLFVTDNVFYGGRAIVYALLAATDPSLVRAVYSLFQHRRGDSEDEPSGLSFWRNGMRTVSSGQMTIHVELEEIRHIDTVEIPGLQFDVRRPDFSSLTTAEAKVALASKGDVSSLKSTQMELALERQQEELDQQQDAQDFGRQI